MKGAGGHDMFLGAILCRAEAQGGQMQREGRREEGKVLGVLATG